eukprot:gnl/MRDRNA2_/MRDRNA2_93922_c0_seq1.p1 gnl/MRDRNA2_/MRDRNA2_93922_c0~~gnl/MRDRNA2_/MRDRNA2_93922_c0_seq1.p1  ORF type:complete len:388 (+),score=64.61 gnl/MRDRNA2_/MRDRNA2_93922_c0_seq1:103-1266(+)
MGCIMRISLLLLLLNVGTMHAQRTNPDSGIRAGNGASCPVSEEDQDALGLIQVRLQMQQHKDAPRSEDDSTNAFSHNTLSESDGDLLLEKYYDSKERGVEDPEDLQERPQDSLHHENCQHELLPSLLWIGLNHAGSTTAAEILNGLPGWSYGKVKEHRFFGPTAHEYLNGACHDLDRARNDAEYKKEFKVGCDVNLTFDASPFYWVLGNDQLKDKICDSGRATKELFMSEPEGRERKLFLDPPGQKSLSNIRYILGENVKIVFAIKDPVDWLSSMGFVEDPEAENLICMADALEGWLSVFPRQNFLFLDSAQMFEDLPGTIYSIVDFAGMPRPKMRLPTASEMSSGRRRNTQTVSDQYRRTFHASFHSCKMRLENLTGLSFNWKGSL